MSTIYIKVVKNVYYIIHVVFRRQIYTVHYGNYRIDNIVCRFLSLSDSNFDPTLVPLLTSMVPSQHPSVTSHSWSKHAGVKSERDLDRERSQHQRIRSVVTLTSRCRHIYTSVKSEQRKTFCFWMNMMMVSSDWMVLFLVIVLCSRCPWKKTESPFTTGSWNEHFLFSFLSPSQDSWVTDPTSVNNAHLFKVTHALFLSQPDLFHSSDHLKINPSFSKAAAMCLQLIGYTRWGFDLSQWQQQRKPISRNLFFLLFEYGK